MRKNQFILLIPLLFFMTACSLAGPNSVTLSGDDYEEYLEDKEIISKIEYLIGAIEENYLYEDELDMEKLEAGLYKGLFAALEDPYSVYYTDSEFEKLTEDSQGEFGGIGIQITAESDDFITVVAPIANTPGDEAGIKSGDKIIAIDGQVYYGSDLEEAVDHMRGEPRTDVTISIRRETEDGYEDKDLTITRQIIKVESVHYDRIGDYSYMRLSSFDENTASDFEEALNEAVNSSSGLILDLRNNPGGLLSSVVEIADMLLPKGDIVRTVDNEGKERIESSDPAMADIEMVVLVNQGSASASEILSGAIQDYERAPIIGTTTFGKGVVQQIFSLEEGGYKITVSEYYTAAGNKIHNKGVSPDFEIELSDQAEGIGPDYYDQDNQLQKAVEVLDKQIQ